MTSEQPAARRAGRPRGRDSSRADILDAARDAFSRTGYDGTSVRTIAVRVGVDPSTVLHFFATKEGLFRAVIETVAPALQPVVDALREGAGGTEIARVYLDVWAEEESGAAMRALFRAALSSEDGIEILREAMIGRVLPALPPESGLGGRLALAHLMGVGIGRHIARVPGLADADAEAIATRLGPVLDGYLRQ
ncbi:TetR/AcrR family transcriptional regulator [Nocardioides sp.]|uniref:TetR/AcrR family transcriptional regulator n=1 Tax=Nocardioides sp. TaxID=35761 RepID=UPI0039E2714C